MNISWFYVRYIFQKNIKDITEFYPNICDSLKKYKWGNKNKFKPIKKIN